MTSETVRLEVEKTPFVPLRFHLVSGKTIEIKTAGIAWMLNAAVMILDEPQQDPEPPLRYDVVAVRNIERIELLVQS